ncbi:15598_t:CDS:2 [Acaulospora colombiana]|uniref:15598_t:CDS:1 n=1 Tax=Acaulospora colombiana TaxID=27376 RepID=A0ACA9LIY4_9GLOM|nr:15598_t:CDS:2 [Acaulospora colombiana]
MLLIDLDVGVARIRGDRDVQMDRFDIKNHYFDEKEDPEFKSSNYEKAFVNAFKREDQALRSTFGALRRGGTTATAALFFSNSNICYIANVGDSTAVLGSIPGGYKEPAATTVSYDDKVDNATEFNRQFCFLRIKWVIDRFVRPLGDFDFKAPFTPSGKDWISPIPHTQKIDLVPHEDEFLIIASDGKQEQFTVQVAGFTNEATLVNCLGLWNVFNEHNVVDEITIFLDRGYSVQQIASVLANTAAKRGQSKSDNVTVMLIYFIWDKRLPQDRLM